MSDIPDHDVLAAGFPCQPFSLAGVSKKNSLGRAHGFDCVTQGTLFFHLATIIEAKRPPVLFLENVRNLLSHDKGQTWQVIRETLDSLRYHIFFDVIDAAAWVPQHRERVYIVCFDKDVFPVRPEFTFPGSPLEPQPVLSDILEKDEDVPDKYTLTDHLWAYLQRYAEKHREQGNGFGFGLASQKDMERTQSKIPPEHRFSLHVNMVSHGRICCTPTTPACLECPVNDLCPKVGVQRPRKRVLPIPAAAMGGQPSSNRKKGSKAQTGHDTRSGSRARSGSKRKNLEPPEG